MNDSCKSMDEYLEEFLLYKQSLGYSYVTHAHYLKKYVSFRKNNEPENMMDKESVDQYLGTLKDAPGTLYGTVCAMREFGRYLRKQGIDAYILAPKTVHQLTPDPPYFFTAEEIGHFFAAADSVRPFSGFRGREYIIPAIFRLMYCCGIRCKEARMLRCKNVFLEKGFLDIMWSKGPKNRRLYISQELVDYLILYDRKISGLYPGREYFFPGYRGRSYVSKCFIANNFRRCWEQSYPDFSGVQYPRAIDFRHHFAWTNINKWASEGLDVNVMLPYLMRYMGHQTVKQTLYYFHFVPDFYPSYRALAESSDDILPEVPQ